MHKSLGLMFTLFALVCVAYAFSPRPDPAMPEMVFGIERFQMLDGLRVGERMVSVGERGMVFVSSDDGTAWRAASAPGEATLTALALVEDQTLVAVGHDSSILRSVDGGDSWTQVYSAPEDQEPLFAVTFVDSRRGLAAGAYGRLLASMDGGLSWGAAEIGDGGADLHLNALVRVGDSVQFVVGEAGTVFRSSNGGIDWAAQDPPYEGSFFGALPLPDEAVLIFGMRGHILRSDDLGERWNEVKHESSESLFGGRVLADGTVVLVGQAGLILVSHDNGRSFKLVPGPDRLTRVAVLERRDGDLLLIGEQGVARLPRALLGGRPL